MPRYRAKEPGFYENKLYSPHGKRPILTVDKPFKNVPSWLEPIKDLTKAEAEIEKKKAKKSKEAEDKKAKEDQIEKDAVTFTEGAKTTIETL